MNARTSVAAVLAISLIASACGDDDATPAAESTSVPPTTVVAPTSDATTTSSPTTVTSATTASTTTSTVVEVSPPQTVTLATLDGLGLEGRVFPAGSTWVILGHMLPADQTSWFDFAAAAQDAGFSALAFNNRGFGESEGSRSDADVAVDALAAIAFARAEGATAIFFAGASMNGAAALWVGAEEDLAGIVTLSGVPVFGATDGLSRAAEITEPKLFVAAEDDGSAVNDAQSFFDASPPPAETLIYATGGHGTDMFDTNPDLVHELLRFFTDNS